MTARPTATPTPTPNPIPVATTPSERRGDLDAIIRGIREAATAPKPTPTPTRIAQAKPTPAPTPTAKPKDDPKAKGGKAAVADKKKKPEPPKNPARIWVQVAGGANASALPKEWSAVSAKHPELKAKGPYTAKNRATNRLLAGPFKTEAEAQAAVVKLRKAGIGAFQWKSDEGEAVQKIGGK